MPAQYTHQIIAERTLEKLPENIRDKITDYSAYAIGAQGGDVFYFLRVLDGKTQNLGKYLHNDDIYETFCSLYKAAKRHPEAFSYVAGYITHYAVDIVFHPYVYGLTERMIGEEPSWRGRWHAYIESDLDSYFVRKYCKKPVNEYSYPVRRRDIDIRALYPLIGGVCREQGRRKFSYRSFCRSFSRFYTFERLFLDKKLRRRGVLNRIEKVLHIPHTFSVLCRRTDYDERCLNKSHKEWHNPSDPSFTSHEDADQLFERAERECLRLIAAFFIGLEGDVPLSREDFGKGFLSGTDAGKPLVRPQKPKKAHRKAALQS